MGVVFRARQVSLTDGVGTFRFNENLRDLTSLRLKAISRNKFVSGDGNVIMEFNQGTSDDMKLSYAPDPSKPSMVSIPAQKAKR